MHVLLIGDGVTLTTGFAQVLRHCLPALQARGWAISQLACLDIGPRHDSGAYHALGVEPYFANPYDHVGRRVLKDVLNATHPDALLINADPATAANWRIELRALGCEIPVVLYAPIEGVPIAPRNAEAFNWASEAWTCTRWSSRALKAEHGLAVRWVHHGVDGDVFKPVSTHKRWAVRRTLGWEGKFVVMYVARNAGRKAQDRLIKALAHLRERGITDVLLYLHCTPYDNHQLQGWDLAGLAHWCGVTDMVQFSPQTQAAFGEQQTTLAEKYAAADLYVHAAKVEGFGLPILEAMASELPVVIPADDGNMQEVAGNAAFATIQPYDWETWFNGAQLALIHPQQFAAVIEAARGAPVMQLHMAGEAGRKHALSFSWDTMATMLADSVARVACEPVPAGVK